MTRRMKAVAGVLRSCSILILAVAWLGGCAISEREAAKRLDRTEEVIRQAASLYAADRELNRYPISVDGFKGAMCLKGQVATSAQKTRAEKVLWAVPGVKSVENRLEVRAPAAK